MKAADPRVCKLWGYTLSTSCYITCCRSDHMQTHLDIISSCLQVLMGSSYLRVVYDAIVSCDFRWKKSLSDQTKKPLLVPKQQNVEQSMCIRCVHLIILMNRECRLVLWRFNSRSHYISSMQSVYRFEIHWKKKNNKLVHEQFSLRSGLISQTITKKPHATRLN